MARLFALLAVLSSAAVAEEAEFPKAGRIVPLGSLSISHSTAGGSSLTQVQIAPTLLYLVGDRFVVGGDLLYRSISSGGGGNTQSSIGGDLLLGGAFPLGPQVTLMLLPSIGVLSLSSGSASRTSFTIGVTVPLLVHLAPHFFIGFGPQLGTEITASQSLGGTSADSDKITTFNFNGFFGGWI